MPNIRIPQSIARRVVLKAYLKTDHISAATGKTIAIVLSKNGVGFGNPHLGATNALEIGSGWYYVDLDATDTGTTGPLIVRGTEANTDDVEVVFDVAAFVDQSGDAYARLGSTPPTVTQIADQVWDEARVGHAGAGSYGATGEWAGSIDTGAIADAVWTKGSRTLTATAAQTQAAMTGSILNITAGTGFLATISGLSIPATWTAILFTVKHALSDADSASIVQIRKSNPGVAADGLLYLAQAPATDAAWGSLTIDQAGGTVAIALKAAATARLEERSWSVYDLKVLRSDGEPTVLTSSTATIALTPTNAIV